MEWLLPPSRANANPVAEYGHDLAKVSKKAGLPAVTSHDFRHYFISTCAAAGIAMKLVIDWVGHKDSTMVLEVYTHLPDNFRQSEAKRLTFDSRPARPKVSRAAEEFFRPLPNSRHC